MRGFDVESRAAAREQGRRHAALYRSVWRWHFYAGLFVAPILLILAITGALYLFEREIETIVYADLMDVTPQAAMLPVSAQAAAVLAVAPGGQIVRYVPGRNPAKAHEWTVKMPDGPNRIIFMDPYSAQAKGSIRADRRLMTLVSRVHGALLMEPAGDWLVELVACWTLALLATGLFLWWPRRGRLRGVLIPRLGAQGRLWWRDMHAISAFFNVACVAFLILSGLPWTGFWGEHLARFGTLSAATAPTPNFGAEPSVKGGADAHVEHSGTQGPGSHGPSHDPDNRDIPWVVRHALPPAGAGRGPFGGIDEVLAILAERGAVGPGLRLFYPQGPNGLYMASVAADRAQEQRTLYIDPADGRVLDDIGWDRYSPLGKAVEWGTTTHMGRQFGLVNQWVGLVCCFFIVLTVVTGAVMWWKRRPAGGGLSAPKPLADRRIPWGFWPAIIGLSILFPMLGASLIAVLGVEAFLGKRGSTMV
jgi:uncharacterized iron-regulated membrane protein